jgi:hypothetical protein
LKEGKKEQLSVTTQVFFISAKLKVKIMTKSSFMVFDKEGNVNVGASYISFRKNVAEYYLLLTL